MLWLQLTGENNNGVITASNVLCKLLWSHFNLFKHPTNKSWYCTLSLDSLWAWRLFSGTWDTGVISACITLKWATSDAGLCPTAQQVSHVASFYKPLSPYWFIRKVLLRSIDLIWGIRKELNHKCIGSSPKWRFYAFLILSLWCWATLQY